MYIFYTLPKVDQSLERVWKVYNEDSNCNLGDNEFSIDVSKEFVIFDLLWDKSDDVLQEYYPLKILTNEFVQFLSELKSFMVKFESCQIPGIIRESKLDTWSCVPNEYIKDDWWEQQKSKNNND